MPEHVWHVIHDHWAPGSSGSYPTFRTCKVTWRLCWCADVAFYADPCTDGLGIRGSLPVPKCQCTLIPNEFVSSQWRLTSKGYCWATVLTLYQVLYLLHQPPVINKACIVFWSMSPITLLNTVHYMHVCWIMAASQLWGSIRPCSVRDCARNVICCCETLAHSEAVFFIVLPVQLNAQHHRLGAYYDSIMHQRSYN